MMVDKLDHRIIATLDLLASRWTGAGVLLPCFSLLAQGESLAVSEMAEASGREVSLIEQTLEAARCRFDDDARLIDLFGMTLEPTLHRLEIGGRIVFSCCALWAHVIPRLIERPVSVESVDPASRQVVRLSISPTGITALDPPRALATLAIADSGSIESDVESAFCRHVRHFATLDSAQRFSLVSPARRVVSLGTLDRAAERLHLAIADQADRAPGTASS
ncbi:MAG TPA: organomercurial lyase [Acidobacteriota bacterium]|nr:organomercurial lyase [Acidobacteriota bacterium]